jgi:hypothetical protein
LFLLVYFVSVAPTTLLDVFNLVFKALVSSFLFSDAFANGRLLGFMFYNPEIANCAKSFSFAPSLNFNNDIQNSFMVKFLATGPN